ncbi:MAG: hypothetical protein QM774_06715 [Gordonia sp. (in: high G+C Gram-positive bacteria)]|uniref:hypothetical protein n=1 Tax=Gordonia sp. (in: high G+C Gram-positive bacteria) TaxID=84139 RepID=UPI0039E4300A
MKAPMVAQPGQVLGDARGRAEGTSWESKDPNGMRVVNQIPVGNGDQTVDQTVYDKNGKVWQRRRVVANGQGGFQRWTSFTDGGAGYDTQYEPGENVSGSQWGQTVAGRPAALNYESTWDGKNYVTESVDADGRIERFEAQQRPDGSVEQRHEHADGSVTIYEQVPGKPRTEVGHVDANGNGWAADPDSLGGRAQIRRDENGNQVVVTTNPDTHSRTTTRIDPVTGRKRDTIVDKDGKELGHVDYDENGRPWRGAYTDGYVRTSWFDGTATITHTGRDRVDVDLKRGRVTIRVGGPDEPRPGWKKITIRPDGSQQILTDKDVEVELDANGEEIKRTKLRPLWRQGVDFLWSADKAVAGKLKGVVVGPVKATANLWWTQNVAIAKARSAYDEYQLSHSEPGEYVPSEDPKARMSRAWAAQRSPYKTFGKSFGELFWTQNPLIVGGRNGYDFVRLTQSRVTGGTYVPSENPVDRAARANKAWIGVDFRDFADPDADKGALVGDAVFGVSMLIIPVKGAGAGAKGAGQAVTRTGTALKEGFKDGKAAAKDAARAGMAKVSDGLAHAKQTASRVGQSVAKKWENCPARRLLGKSGSLYPKRGTSIDADSLDIAVKTRVLNTPKPNRPDPSTYLSKSYIAAHRRLFDGGAVRIQPKAPNGRIGHSETWVLPRSVAMDAIAKAGGDVSALERLLGFDPGYLGKNPVLIDIPRPQGLRIPSGNEFGANNFWRPGGFTYPGRVPEAVIKPVEPGSYTVAPVF